MRYSRGERVHRPVREATISNERRRGHKRKLRTRGSCGRFLSREEHLSGPSPPSPLRPSVAVYSTDIIDSRQIKNLFCPKFSGPREDLLNEITVIKHPDAFTSDIHRYSTSRKLPIPSTLSPFSIDPFSCLDLAMGNSVV